MENFSWATFGISIVETAIGATLGFVLGLVAFHYQHKREKKAEAEEAKEAALDALNRLMQSAGLNIEMLANVKIQLITDLEPEVAAMKNAVTAFYDDTTSGRSARFPEIKSMSEAMVHFYQTAPQLMIMPAPDYREFSLLAHDMPALTAFTHRAMSTMHELNQVIRQRNELISQHAKEAAVGMTAERCVYFWSMLCGTGDYVCQSIDNDIEFFRLVMEQIDRYMKAKHKGKLYLTYQIATKAKEAMSSEDLFPELRKQMATFGETK